MMNPTLLWFIAIPIAIGLVLWYLRRDFENAWMFCAAFSVGGMILIGTVFAISSSAATWDTEVWNGQITAKARVHDSYVESYQCNCRSVTSGSGKNQTTTTVCDTCYQDHYTVKWGCNSTVGSFLIAAEDWTSKRVYDLPNPPRWSSIQPGDPAAKSHRYTNYVQAVPESLFTPSSASLKAKFAGLVPKYPDNVYDFYRNDHFLSPGYAMADAPLWNQDLAIALRELGPKKQVNAIVVIAKTSDPDYEYALRDGWGGAKKNDVVLVIGSSQFPKIDFVRVISWTKNELFKVELRDKVMALGNVTRAGVVSALTEQIGTNFERRHMKEFEYLKSEIDPPMWVLAITLFVLLGAAGGTWYYTKPRRPQVSLRRL